MPPNRNIDWEGELAIVIGKQALNVTRGEGARLRVRLQHHVRRERSRRTGTSAHRHVSRHELVPRQEPRQERAVRSVHRAEGIRAQPAALPHRDQGERRRKQDGNTSNWIWDEAHMIRYLSSILSLYPGDVISSGTPDGVGAGRKPPEFLKPGDVVTIEVDGIGTLRTPMKAASRFQRNDACENREHALHTHKKKSIFFVGSRFRCSCSAVVAARCLPPGRHDPGQRPHRHRRCALLDRAGGRDCRRQVHGRRRERRRPQARRPDRRRRSICTAQTVIPGLADDHLHDAGGGPGVDLSRTRSIATSSRRSPRA